MKKNQGKSLAIILLILIITGAVIAWVLIGAGSGSAPEKKAAVDDSVLKSVETSVAPQSSFVAMERADGEFTDIVSPKRQPKEITLICPKVDSAPVIDGLKNEKLWLKAAKITTIDFLSQREVEISCVRNDTHIFFLVSYPDISASLTQKTYRWDESLKIYKQYTDREDVFVFKWSMQGADAKLALYDHYPHKADVWFWKSCRTDPSGFADDKHQILTTEAVSDTLKIVHEHDEELYLVRKGDAGRSAYEERIPVGYKGKWMQRYWPRQALGSRGDIKAKGFWKDGRWTIEFARLLDTQNPDDQAFDLSGEYLFGISCYEIAGDTVHPEYTQPLYRCGDVFDRIILKFAQ